jgi:hypothetical protein
MKTLGLARYFISRLLVAIVVLPLGQISTGCRSARIASAESHTEATETIVMFRHGEKPAEGLGQIDCKGLNRALALPDILFGRFGKPDFAYAPDPSLQVTDHGQAYSYVRPLASIEPTAIRAGIPVNTQFGYTQIDKLQAALTQPGYANARVFVAWEHGYLHSVAQQLLKTYGQDPAIVPPWPGSDFDTIYVFQLIRTNGKPHLTFRVDREGLNGSLSDACPGAPKR